ncbi:hypothetical protein [Lacticaseibacillus kribbianus]|uniref:hypothetical protein n=1 Tax=Lacticaseibacillus kribbianus TaxID=2926292 RepID=UPI001CD52B9A|nr:hypothetical protein [Lacticaseibacillus kribbianus]
MAQYGLSLDKQKAMSWSELFDYLLNEYADDADAVEYIKGEREDYKSVKEPRRWQLTVDLVVSMELYY